MKSISTSSCSAFLKWYILFGALHEATHVVTALLAGVPWHDGIVQDGFLPFLFRTVLGRHSVIFDVHGDVNWETSLSIVRHAGWVASLILALLIPHNFKNARLAAALTAVDAITTDLLQWRILLPVMKCTTSVYENASVFYCGNFGMILLHHLWLTDQGQAALDILEKMVKVTMMRGAQSGGVITFRPKHSRDATGKPTLEGIRSRVVNQKRTDLSVEIRKIIKQQVFRSSKTFPEDFHPVLSGHTRFATSSKASLEGTHPHCWTPAAARRVYDFSIHRSQDSSPQVLNVENYITHNGDFDFYVVNGKTYDLGIIQKWLVITTGFPMPASVDSCAVAGVIDLLRTQGCFGLSARYAVCFGLPTSKIEEDIDNFPAYSHFEKIGGVFEEVVGDMIKTSSSSLECICDTEETRNSFALQVLSKLEARYDELILPIGRYIDAESGSSILAFCMVTIDAFFDNDLLMTTKMFFKNAKGSFGVCITSSLDAHRQICLAARGQTMSVAFYPSKCLVCYGSEQAAVKAGLKTECPGVEAALSQSIELKDHNAVRLDLDHLGGEIVLLDWGKRKYKNPPVSKPNCHLVQHELMNGCIHAILYQESKVPIQDPDYGSEQAAVKAGLNTKCPGVEAVLSRSIELKDHNAVRLDLDHLGGEIVLLDWGQRKYKNPPVSKPNCHLVQHELMNECIHAILYQESKVPIQDPELYHRLTQLSSNRFIKPIPEESKDLILTDLQDIPKICQSIQDEWHSDRAHSSLNRLTAYNLSRCLRDRLEARVAGTVHSQAIDILLTGCEVSLWLAEQFASDLQKSFPKLCIKAVSSNKLLGLYGQEIAVPTFGFPYSQATNNLHDSIVIIISHSGGTFAPLACSQLLQSATKNIFVVTSEWDTQIANQLRIMDALDDEHQEHVFNSRVFSTEVGMRPAEPCSLSVVATHQLLTNLFEYIAVIILSDQHFRRATGSVMSEQDLQILEKCNKLNVDALAAIVGANIFGDILEDSDGINFELRKAGDVWAEHILENSKAYIMSFVYIFATVIAGYPIFYALAFFAGLHESNNWIYLIRLLDAATYFWLPQINITILRLIQRRNLLHRMVGRTVVIGDIPWVAQSAEAFLSKIFACSYSIAGLNVLSGNPSDHLVHRHTHRVVRGSLVICGRPDGRLSALSSAEASVCLSVNQASSIQSLGGTCESITVGHNPFKLPLSKKCIFLKRQRPLFLCERILIESDVKEERTTLHGVRPRQLKKRSATALVGAYMNLDEGASEEDARAIFASVDHENSGLMDYDQFINLMKTSCLDQMVKLTPSNRDKRGIIQIEASREKYFGELLRKYNAGKAMREVDFMLARNQHFSQELYETRIASLQRFVAMTVIFHQMGKRVQEFFAKISFGLLGYRMDRTHSIMRIATTASPISGSDVRQRMRHLQLLTKVTHSINVISTAYLAYKAKKKLE